MMIPVLASSHVQFLNFCRNKNIPKKEAKYICNEMELRGISRDTVILILEDFQYNKNYTLELMKFISVRFFNPVFLSEKEIYE